MYFIASSFSEWSRLRRTADEEKDTRPFRIRDQRWATATRTPSAMRTAPAAPASLTTLYAVAEATRSADRPTASALACTASPERLPRIVACAARRPRVTTCLVTSAMSAPGTTVTTSEPTRKTKVVWHRRILRAATRSRIWVLAPQGLLDLTCATPCEE